MHITTPLAAMGVADKRDARTFARYMMLNGGPTSPEAIAFAAFIVNEIVVPWKAAKGQVRPLSIGRYRKITPAFLSDLLLAAAAGRWSCLRTNSEALAHIPSKSRSAFDDMRQALGDAGLLEELKGYAKGLGVSPTGNGGRGYTQAVPTSFRPTLKLLELAESRHGLRLADCKDHFTFGSVKESPPAEIVEARASKLEKRSKPVALSQRKAIYRNPKAAKIIADMRCLNAYLLADGRISGIAFAGLRRIFSNADQPGFDWQWQGRFYAMPNTDRYGNMEGGFASRSRVIRIDGEAPAEVDVSASHLTILHGIVGVPFDPERDPYALSPDLDREMVKEWINRKALGNSDPTAGGPRFARERVAALARYPFLSDLPTLDFGPLDGQYHESEIMRLAMEELMAHGVGFLPVHDSLLVAPGNVELAKEAIRSAFRRYFVETMGTDAGPVPRLSVKLSRSVATYAQGGLNDAACRGQSTSATVCARQDSSAPP